MSARSCRRSRRTLRRARIRRLTASLARLVRSLHERSLSHRDLKAANILIRTDTIDGERSAEPDRPGRRPAPPSAAAEAPRPEPGAAASAWPCPGRTRTDALRFLRLYLPWGLSPLNDWKASGGRSSGRCGPSGPGTCGAAGRCPDRTRRALSGSAESTIGRSDGPAGCPAALGLTAAPAGLGRLRDARRPRADRSSRPATRSAPARSSSSRTPR